MAVLYDIKIIDTKNQDRDISIEKTEQGSPKLIYNGADVKFHNLITSEIQFNMLVPIQDEAYFFHLFTGDETRFKVVVETRDENNQVELFWQGFLLPEQFSEPYEHSGFFVDFVASDGVARLKRKYLDFSFYEEKKSVIQILIACLNKTGLFLDLWFAPAFQQLFFELNYTDLIIDTTVYDDEGKKKNAYDILTDLLVSIGCKLFQCKGRWVVLGLNEFAQDKIEFFEYKNGYLQQFIYQGKTVYERSKKFIKFYSQQIISVDPLLNEMNVTWDADNSKHLIPEDAINAYPLNFDSDVEDRTPKYWNLVSNEDVELNVLLSFYAINYDYSGVDFSNNYLGFIATPNYDKVAIGPYLRFLRLLSSKTSLNSNYATLEDSFYVEGSDNLERYATLNIEFEYSPVEDASLSDNIKNGFYDGIFYFAVTRKEFKNSGTADESIILSNIDYVDIPEGIYDFKLSAVGSSQIKGILRIDKILLRESGWYNLRLYPPVYKPVLDTVYIDVGLVFTKCSFTLNHQDEDDELIVNRGLSFTTTHDEELFHAASMSRYSKRRFDFSDLIKTQIQNSTLFPVNVALSPLGYSLKEVEYLGSPNMELLFINVTKADFNYLKNGYKLYVKKSGSSIFEKVNENNYSVVFDSEYGGECIVQIKLVTINSQDLFIEEDDELEMRLSTQIYNYSDFLLGRWKLSTDLDVASYKDVFANMYLKLLNEVNVKMSGVCLGLVSPMEIVRFNYQGLREYNVENVTLDLTNNQSELVVIERKIGSVLDSEDYDLEINDGVSFPQISLTISSVFVEPDLFGPYVYSINTSYNIEGINQVDAELYQRKLVNYVNSTDFGYEGSEEVFLVSDKEGNVFKNFGFELVAQEVGWYELEMIQEGYSSNKQYVYVSSSIPAIVESNISISKIDIGDVLNKKGKYAVALLNGYSPQSLQQVMQKFNVNTQMLEPSIIIKDLDLVNTEFEIDFPSSGSWRVFVQSTEHKSNVLSWLSIQV
jgi:hypothetical protein